MRFPLLVVAPLFVAGYGVARLAGQADGHYGPGLDWQVAHGLALIGMLLFIPALLRLPDFPWRKTALGITVLGLTASVVQFAADMVFAARAADKAAMSRLSHDFRDIPFVDLAVYKVGPQLFFVGLVILAALLARSRRLPWWSPALLLVSVLLPIVTLDLIPLAGLGIAIAFLPLRPHPA